jgi:hypothetical protein
MMTEEQVGGVTLVTSKPSELREHVSKNLEGNFRVLYQPKDGSVINHWRHVGVIAYAAGDLTLCLDELGFLCKSGQFLPDCVGDEPMLYKIVHFGRHRNIKVIATAQRPTNMALSYRGMASEFRIFRTDEPNDMKYLSERIGQKTVELLPNLPDYAFVLWRDSGEVAVVKS